MIFLSRGLGFSLGVLSSGIDSENSSFSSRLKGASVSGLHAFQRSPRRGDLNMFHQEEASGQIQDGMKRLYVLDMYDCHLTTVRL